VTTGVLVVGAAHGAQESAAAEAVADSLRRAGSDPTRIAAVALGPDAGEAVHSHRAVASPVTAARHEGGSIDPAALVDRVRAASPDGQPLVVSAAGGLLAPLTPRYSVRDLARDLALPLVLAVRAGADAVNLARLSLESARGAGLPVAAVVLTGWPDPPDRVLLDERALLREVVGVPVLVLDGTARDWPVLDWLEATAEPAAAPVEVKVVLDPYEAWESRPMGDPRATPRPRIMEAMLEIIAAEGPMRATRAYSLYNKAAGGKKLTSIARAPLSSAIYWLAQEGKIVLTKRDEIPWQDDDLVRMPDTPAVRVRELGPRTLEEVPLDEVAELMRRLRPAHPGEEALKRAVLNTYGLVRLTTRADEYLGLAYGLVER
jgi:dethiobiotin synthetase